MPGQCHAQRFALLSDYKGCWHRSIFYTLSNTTVFQQNKT